MSENPKTRLLALEDLTDFLEESEIEYSEYKKIWKILFFALWDSDKVKNQN